MAKRNGKKPTREEIDERLRRSREVGRKLQELMEHREQLAREREARRFGWFRGRRRSQPA
jgi:hypothetical protein